MYSVFLAFTSRQFCLCFCSVDNITLDEQLMCPIQYQSLLVCLVISNGIF